MTGHMSAKPTAGEWKADWTRAGKVAWRVMDSKKRSIVTILATQDRPPAEKQANAALIAEAGTVLHETGCTPRQLAAQRAELQARLSKPGHAHLDGDHLMNKVDGCVLCNAMTERDSLKEQRAELVKELEVRSGDLHMLINQSRPAWKWVLSRLLDMKRETDAALAKVRGGAA